jgi:drug/metabolite transporter (DMT)-like permease
VLLLLLAALSTAIGSVASGHVPQPPDPLLGAVVQMGVAGLVLLPAAVLRREPAQLELETVSARSAVALLYLIVIGSVVAYSAFVWLLANVSVSTVSTYAYVNPVVAVLIGWALLDERLTARVALGALVIVTAVAAIVREPPSRPR